MATFPEIAAELVSGQLKLKDDRIAQLEQRLDEANESALNAYGEGIKDCETRIKQEGMVQVPVEPTEAMLNAAPNYVGFRHDDAREVYKAMLAAHQQRAGEGE